MTSQNIRNHPGQPSDTTRQRLRAQLADPDIRDLQNPAFLFSTTTTDLLLAIAGGLIDPVRLARRELANRGLDANGRWIGFAAAERLHLGDQGERS
ncbi:hypothetical protein KKA85_04270 [bacterium]|nr:hypothetical protein [bacterium]